MNMALLLNTALALVLATQTAARDLRVPLRSTATLLLVALLGLISACGYKTSSSSFISNGTGTTVAPTITSISVEPFSSAVPRGLTQQFTATALYSNGTKADVSGSVTWSLGTAGPATIDATGLLTAVNLGTTTVTATLGAVAGSAPLTVTAATLVSIDITPVSPSVASGSQLQLLATGIYTDFSTQNLTTTVAWSSNTPLVATISNAAGTQGVATGVTSGTATITATLGAATGTKLLTGTGATLVSIAVMPANATVALGLTQPFTATGTYSNGTHQPLTNVVTWASSMSAATFSNVGGTQGVATTSADGMTVISATYGGVVGSTHLTVFSAHAYATNYEDNTISQYNIETNGTLTPLPTVGTGTGPFSIAITPANNFAYVGNFNANSPNASTISEYSISSIDGSLSPLPTATVATGINPNSVTLDPSATHLYATNLNYQGSLTTPGILGTISQYMIVDGTLVPIMGPLPTTGAQPASLAINPLGTFAYVANYGDGSVSQFMIGNEGALQTIPNEPATVPAQSGSSYVIVDPTGNYVYVTNQSAGTISEYSIGMHGGLTNIGTTPVVATGNGPSFIAIDATGSYAYVADSISNDVSLYNIGKGNGLLTLVTSYMTGTGSRPYGVTIDATGKFLYVAERANPGKIAQFAISAVDGTLTPLQPPTVASGSQPTSIVTTP